jgi:hypothetical protein
MLGPDRVLLKLGFIAVWSLPLKFDDTDTSGSTAGVTNKVIQLACVNGLPDLGRRRPVHRRFPVPDRLRDGLHLDGDDAARRLGGKIHSRSRH